MIESHTEKEFLTILPLFRFSPLIERFLLDKTAKCCSFMSSVFF
jgi:hypothetical protein